MVNYKRIDAIDIAKGIGIVLVVIGHLPLPFSPILRFIYNFHMPLFFFLSGLFMNERRGGQEFLVLKIKTLLIPLLAFCLFARLINYIPQFDINGNIFDMGLGEKALWFLPVLFSTENIIFILWRLVGNRAWRIAITILFIVIALIVDIYSPIEPFSIWAPSAIPQASAYYALGFIASPNVKQYCRKGMKWEELFGIISLAVLLIGSYFIKDFSNMNYGHLCHGILAFVIAILGILTTIVISRIIENKCLVLKRFLLYCGKNSLIIFGTHLAIKGLYDRLFGMISLDNPIGYFFGVVAICLGVWLCIEIINSKLKWTIGKF